MKKTSLSIVTAICLSVPAIAFAEHGKPCPIQDKKECAKHHNVEGMDTNSDGKVSFNEFKKTHTKNLKKKFERMDANGDGFISKADREARHQKRMDKFFDNADSNKDGVLSKEEFEAAKKNRPYIKHDGHKGQHCKY